MYPRRVSRKSGPLKKGGPVGAIVPNNLHHSSSRMELSKSTHELVVQLSDRASDIASTLSQLEVRVSDEGVLLEDLATLLDLVFEPSVSSLVRNRVLFSCLIPAGDYVIPARVYLRVLGSLGPPDVYYKNGKQYKLKRFSLPTQQRILQWTINILPFFGPGLHSVLRRSLPMLMSLLAYEYLRPYIATFIVVATAMPSSLDMLNFPKKCPLRSWHVRLVAELRDRFPLDASLAALIFHFSRLDILLDIRRFMSSQGPFLVLIGEGISVPDAEFILALRIEANPRNEAPILPEILGVHQHLSHVYKGFPKGSKRRKVGPQPLQGADPFSCTSNESDVLISSVTSVSSLITSLENIVFINPSSVFARTQTANHRFRCLYVSLVLMASGKTSPVFRKMASAILYHVLCKTSHSTKYDELLLENFARYTTLQYFESELESCISAPFTELENLLRLMPYIHLVKSDVMRPFIDRTFACMNQLLSEHPEDLRELIPRIMTRLITSLVKLCSMETHVLHTLLEAILPALFNTMDTFWARMHLQSKLSCLALMRTIIEVGIEYQSSWHNCALLVPPPLLMFRLVVCTHPLVVSEALGYVACMKKLTIPEPNNPRAALKNAYVIDTINFIWRGMAFKYERDTLNHGMFLHPLFLQSMGGLDFFCNSDLILTTTVGDIVHNPAFAYLCAEIVWKLEDLEPDITVRHPGPISEASVAQLHQDLDATWLRMSYQESKVSLLNHLDAMGYKGLADLLFTSLKPLVDQRTSTVDSFYKKI